MLVACSGFTSRDDSTSTTTATSGPGGSGAGAGGLTGAGGSTSNGGGPYGGPCPQPMPEDGDPCVLQTDGNGFPIVADCTYGDDPRPSCRKLARCTLEGEWEITDPDSSCNDGPLPEGCGTMPHAVGSECTDTELSCWYPSGKHCWCSPCRDGIAYPVCEPIDPPQWACSEPASGCPTTVPQAGDSCTQEGLDCGPNCDLQVVCQGGTWVWLQGNCPMCAAPDTPIATPSGDRPIASLRAGDWVYSVHDDAIVAVPLARAESTRVRSHRVMRVTLESGAVLEISPSHPTADGRTFGDLSAGDVLDRERVVAAELVPYTHTRTHDILPESETGTYFAAGERIGTTLR